VVQRRPILLITENQDLFRLVADALHGHGFTLSREDPVGSTVATDTGRRLVILDAASLLDTGNDDGLDASVSSDALIARMRELLRSRSGRREPAHEPLVVGEMRIDPATRTVSVNGDGIACTPTEYDIVEYLARNAGHVVRRDELSEAVCGRVASPLDRAIDVHVSHLRGKLRQHRQRIVTIRGVGYLLAGDGCSRR
jgi:DNA-binding response OmpR family regulator